MLDSEDEDLAQPNAKGCEFECSRKLSMLSFVIVICYLYPMDLDCSGDEQDQMMMKAVFSLDKLFESFVQVAESLTTCRNEYKTLLKRAQMHC